jgi:hypothetical protein
VCQHFEWTSRKIDFYDLAPDTPASIRQRVAYWIGRTSGGSTPPSTSSPKEGFLMALSDKQQDELYEWVNELRLGRPHKLYGRDWMAENLPGIVREVVREELDSVKTARHVKTYARNYIKENVEPTLAEIIRAVTDEG